MEVSIEVSLLGDPKNSHQIFFKNDPCKNGDLTLARYCIDGHEGLSFSSKKPFKGPRSCWKERKIIGFCPLQGVIDLTSWHIGDFLPIWPPKIFDCLPYYHFNAISFDLLRYSPKHNPKVDDN